MKSSKTNPLGAGTVNIGCNVPERVKEELERLAENSGVSFSVYVRAVLIQAIASELRMDEIGERLFLRDNITEYRIVSRSEKKGKEILQAALRKHTKDEI